MRYEYHCKYCNLPHEINKSIDRMKDTEFCRQCSLPLERKFSIPVIHIPKMAGNIGGEDYRITNEPPEELKPDHYQESLKHDLEHWKIVSTPTHTRRAGTIERP